MNHATKKLAFLATAVLGVVGMASAAAAATTVSLHEPHKGTDFAAFGSEDDCGGLDPEAGPVWHFIANQLSGSAGTGSIEATFESRDGSTSETIVASSSKVLKKVQHFYVQSTLPVLVDATATFASDQPRAKLVLSHVGGSEVEEPPYECPTGTTWVDGNFDQVVQPEECIPDEPPYECPEGTEWIDDNFDEVVQPEECYPSGS